MILRKTEFLGWRATKMKMTPETEVRTGAKSKTAPSEAALDLVRSRKRQN